MLNTDPAAKVRAECGRLERLVSILGREMEQVKQRERLRAQTAANDGDGVALLRRETEALIRMALCLEIRGRAKAACVCVCVCVCLFVSAPSCRKIHCCPERHNLFCIAF